MSDLNYTTLQTKDIDTYTAIEDEVAYFEDIEKMRIYQDGEWHDINIGDIKLNLYELNKQIISQLPVIDNIDEKIELIDNYFLTTKNCYYLLYGKEISYFTLFAMSPLMSDLVGLGAAAIECLKNVGAIKAIDLTESGDAVEIWVESLTGPTCLYLFSYDAGLVEVQIP